MVFTMENVYFHSTSLYTGCHAGASIAVTKPEVSAQDLGGSDLEQLLLTNRISFSAVEQMVRTGTAHPIHMSAVFAVVGFCEGDIGTAHLIQDSGLSIQDHHHRSLYGLPLFVH